jgi:voltage-gated potassium channel
MSQRLVKGQMIEIVVAMAIIASLLSVMIYYSFDLQPNQELIVYIFDLAIVVLLAVNFFHKLRVSGKGLGFIAKYWYQIPALLPLVLFVYIDNQVPSVDLSLLSFITFFRIFMLYHLLKHFRRNEFAYLTAFLAITIIFGSISILFVEPSSPGATIVNFGDAIWWSISTMTSVAYGDVYPVTIEGKVIATALMFAGIGILWTFLAAVSSKLVAQRLEGKDAHEASQSKLNSASRSLTASPDDYNPAASNSKGEKYSKKNDGPDYDALIDMVEILRKLDQKDYDALIEGITAIKRDEGTKKG